MTDVAALSDNCLFTGFIGVLKGLPEQSCYASLI